MATKKQNEAAAKAAEDKKAAEAAAKEGNETSDDEPVPEPEQNLKQRKVGRGSRRRITRALDKFEAAVKEVCTELDLQIFDADEDGKRIGDWDTVKKIGEIPTMVRGEVMAVLNQE